MLIPLKTLIDVFKEDRDLINRFLSSFSCEKDSDIEYFLHERAIEFEYLSKARTYLVCDALQLESQSINNVDIYGYISIALKILTIPDDVSNRKRKELDGLSAKIHGKQIGDFPCYLVGQLSKNSNIKNNPISGNDLINYASDIIATSVDAVGGRFMMIECHDEEHLISFYQNNYFSEIARIPDNTLPMIQMIRKII